MASSSFLVIRIHPDSPVDAGTFGTYLDGLQIQAYQAGEPQTPATLLGETAVASPPVTLVQLPWEPDTYIESVLKLVEQGTKQVSANNYGTQLVFADATDISVGSVVTASDTSVFAGNTTVTNISAPSGSPPTQTVTLSQPIQKFVAAGTVVTFYFIYGPGGPGSISINPNWGGANPAFSFQLKTKAKANNTATVSFANAAGVSVGMQVSAAGVPAGTSVTGSTATSVTLSNPVTLANNTLVTFTENLSSGIVQHIEPLFLPGGFPIPASVATAIIPLSSPPPANDYLDVSIIATRNKLTIPVNNDFYNVIVTSGDIPTPDLYQAIPLAQTSLYLTLPAPPLNSNTINLTIPSDGTAPAFDALFAAMHLALKNDPFFPAATDISTLSVDQCTRVAYDIAWSQQNLLPPPPDPLEALYTNPPNPGGSNSSNGTNNLEQDRQKFEGTVNSFYSIRNAEAERLTKFVAAASAAIFCEQTSLNSMSALLEFPVDPTSSFATAVESELLIKGVGVSGTSGLSFGVPAAFFYALGANLDKSTTASQRFQLATGDAIERLLQLFRRAESGGSINDSEPFANTGLGLPNITSFQAARRLVALRISAASTSPVVTVAAGSPLASLIKDWLATADPTPMPPPNPPLTYQNTDFNIWTQQLAKSDPQGYLYLDLDALTQGYVIPTINTLLATAIFQFLQSITNPPTVETLENITAAEWTSFFKTAPASPTWLPIFVRPGGGAPPSAPGYVDACIKAFIRAVQKFFTVSSAPNAAPQVTPGEPATFGLPPFDAISQAVAKLGPGFTFGKGSLTAAQIEAAVQGVFTPGANAKAEAWLAQAIATINELYQIASVVLEITPNASPVPGNLPYSIMEALYARGFRSAKEITALSPVEFQQELTGTVAYAYAGTATTLLYQAAAAIAPPSASTSPAKGSFQPINSDGTLTNCIPPQCLSPLGPVAYLQELLQLSQDATCENFHSGNQQDQSPTLGSAIHGRRGPLGNLLATCANLETPLPMVDIVNECLEFMGSVPAHGSGTVYNTSSDAVAGHTLCHEEVCPDQEKRASCHDPARLLAALPEYSTPATPVAANSAVDPQVYNKLEKDFSSCCLPYSQALDVSRTYLRHLRSCRFEEMRTFRKCITEFVLDPVKEPAGFQSYRWRYPVRIDSAMEYLGITPQEYTRLFHGALPGPCADSGDNTSEETSQVNVWQLYGFASPGDNNSWTTTVVKLPEFLERTCLTYCEFFELWQSGFVPFRNGDDQKNDAFPQCEPCCLDKLRLQFGQGEDAVQLLDQGLLKLAVFIRLWRKLKESCCFCYSFAQLRDICEVLRLFKDGAVNPDFVRQLAAFQMFRDDFRMELRDPDDKSAPTATGANRTHLLALWVGAKGEKWSWAVNQMLERIADHARRHHKSAPRSTEFVKLLATNLDPLSRLAGFDPGTSTDTWNALPTHTLRFAEVLAKIYASRFSIGEILYLFTAQDHLDGDDPFPLDEANEALDSPLDLPDDQHEHSLWELRQKLLEARIPAEEAHEWSWKRIESALRDDFGFAEGDVRSLGEHFFPGILEHAGYQVDDKSKRYFSNLASATTVAQMWNTPPDGPFQYDLNSQQLWTELPLAGEAVITKLTHVRPLTAPEQQAVQDLYFQPRARMATFALLFTDFEAAQRQMIEEREEKERWAFFRRQFALCHRRYHIIAEHLSAHVAFATGQGCPEADQPAFLILRGLFADENMATTAWEDDSGKAPQVTWTPPVNGGALAALLGLIGTGLKAEYKAESGGLVWRTASGPLSAFGRLNDKEDCPVPTVLPSMGFALTPQQMQYVSVLNGFGIKDATGVRLGGLEGFEVSWSGALLIEREGDYEFWAGAPTAEGEEPDEEAARHSRWRVILKRGQRTWILLSHNWPGEHDHRSSALALKRGAYELSVEFAHPSPAFLNEEQVHPQHTGFQLKYCGPDSYDKRIEIPHHRLFLIAKDESLGSGITTQSPGATTFLGRYYVSSLRDIRRTYQRAFKALLVAHRFDLSARRGAEGQSELGYMLQQPANFAGAAYYLPKNGTVFQQHLACFDFNFLPLLDNFHAPSSTQDQRTSPSAQRTQAMFDWWERIFDYAHVRKDVHNRCHRAVWPLFVEALEKQPANPSYLLRHICADSRHWPLDLRYYQGQKSTVYSVSFTDLEDERWLLRAWHADTWIRSLLNRFHTKDVTQARPDWWASDDPSAGVGGEKETGNVNLSAFLCDGCFENGEPRRYEEVKRLNDGLRERGRKALLSHLCRMKRVRLPWLPGQFAQVPRDLSDLLLLDVESGLCERTSRIEEAITAVQNYVRRARLGLEPGWAVTCGFAQLWDQRFATYRAWEACRRRELYKENWIDWDELEGARRVEAFRFLESGLRRSTLTIAEPGGDEWWPDQRPRAHERLTALQKNEPSFIQQLPGTPLTPEGWTIMGTPERDAQLSWLAAPSLPGSGASSQPQPAADGPSAGNKALIGLARKTAQDTLPANLPFWLESAIRLGTQFVRVAAAGQPAASAEWAPIPDHRHPGCCVECGCVHAPLVDEYYFWLIPAQKFVRPDEADGVETKTPGSFQFGIQDSFYDQTQQQSLSWNDTTKLPPLLHWPSNPAVRLAWCRVHNGEFGQPRQSVTSVMIDPAATSPASIQFLGRANDSLFFSVEGAAQPPSGDTDTSPPGFRYDLPVDDAVALPLAVPPPKPAASPNPGGLPAYPFFAFDSPGASLYPQSLFAPALVVADSLRTRCRFDLALKWYELTFAPLQNDCTWVHCGGQDHPVPPPNQPGGDSTPVNRVGAVLEVTSADLAEGACCDSTNISCAQARNRSIILHYLETLVEWGDAVMRRGNSPEAFQQARLIFDATDMILGKTPCNVRLRESAAPQMVSAFKPEFASLNPRLLDLYAIVRDRLDSIRACLNLRRLKNGWLDCEMPYFGNSPLLEGWRTNCDPCAEEAEWCLPRSPYRFLFRIQKALELAAAVREFGSALLSAFEKGDGEYLASVRAEHERELLALGLAVRQDQWRDADWQIQALQQTKDVNQTNLLYYTNLYQNGLINDESQNLSLATNAMQTRTSANIVEAFAESFKIVPDFFVGAMSTFTQIPIGTKLAGLFETIAKVMQTVAEIQSATAAIDLTQAGWQRRSDEWFHQMRTLPIEIQQIELQILGAQRRRAQALQELNNQQRQFEQSTEVLNFLRDKFTDDKLYLWMQKETSGLYRRMYELALYAARQAERAFNFERGYTTRRFLPDEIWNTLHEGILAGERLEFALHRMEKAYLDENVREYELTKHFSLRRHFPMEFLRLRTTGSCEIDIPEWMFDLDYPGHYMRRIKSVTLTIPCVTGPYTGVHCRLTLISSVTRIHPRLSASLHDCCCPPEPCGCDCGEDERLRREYEPCPDDPRIVRHYSACEAIATSTAQNDSGLFELNFSDQRYLPFEFMGAVSRWRIELPRENNYFDFDSLSDTIIRMNYTAREGGELLRRAANEAARRHLPGDGWCFFEVRHEFPDTWQLFRDSARDKRSAEHLKLRFDRKMFPFVPGSHEVWIDKMAILFDTRTHDDCGCPEIQGCPCPEPGEPACRVVEFSEGHEDRDDECVRKLSVCCPVSDQCPDLYCGIFDTHVGPLGSNSHRREVGFRFPAGTGEVEHVFLLCRYTLKPMNRESRAVTGFGR
jgi:hypothetical protein